MCFFLASFIQHNYFVIHPHCISNSFLLLCSTPLHGHTMEVKVLKIQSRTGLPWWLSGKESAWQCRKHGFEPCSGKIPHTTEQLSPCTTTIEPVLLSLGATLLSPRATAPEASAPQSQAPQQETTVRSPSTATREKAPQQPKTQYSKKINKTFFFFKEKEELKKLYLNNHIVTPGYSLLGFKS